MLTATVTPDAGVNDVQRFDPAVRYRDYLQACTHYARAMQGRPVAVVIAENSGADLGRLLEEFRGRGVEAQPCPVVASKSSVQRGKGAGESELIDAAVTLVEERWGPSVAVMKITGRLRLSNIRRLEADVTSEGFGCRISRELHMVDSRLLTFTPGIWTRWFARMAEDVAEAEGIHLEHVVAQRLLVAQQRGGVHWRRLRWEPGWVGISGSTGMRFGAPWRRPARLLVQLQRLLPLPRHL